MDDHNPPPLATDPLGARSATALRDLQDRAQAAIAVRREQAARLEADIVARLDAVAAAFVDEVATNTVDAREAQQAQAEAKRITTELEDARAAMKLERAAWESEREALEKERAAAGVERTKFEAERAAWATEQSTFESERAAWNVERTALATERKSWDAERSAWDTERNKLTVAAAKLEADVRTAEAEQHSLAEGQRTAQDDLRKHSAELERKLLDERAAHEREQAERTEERAEFDAQLDQARQKFELALEDVQRLRTKVTELEQDLARRPATDKADSAELVALRAERDALAAQVEQLESAPAGRADANADQELADLRRRFELAVEDVRELKRKNGKLEAQAAGAKQHSVVAADSDGMDWESQKRRLLASLAGNGDDEDDPVVEKERASIESTIEITDAVVAEKDQLIAELKAQLATAGDGKTAAARSEREAETNKLLDADAVIVEHRQKTAQLEQEMEGKLRSAELELSVERAKIARQRAELEQLRSELESQRQSQDTHDGPSSPGTPKRRWLSKLGLTGEENA
jgi:chromosome segregation ATPase